MNLFDIRKNLNAARVVRPGESYQGAIRGNGNSNGNGNPQRRPNGNGQPMRNPQYQSPEQSFEEQIMGDTVINPTLHHDIGGVSQVSNDDSVGQSWATLIFDNSAGGSAVRYRFGSDTGALLLGLDALPVADDGSNSPDGINRAFETGPVLIGAIFMTTSSDAQQFQQEFTYHKGGKMNGDSRGTSAFPMRLAKRPQYQNDLLSIIQSNNKPWRFGQYEQGTITVLDGQIVTLDFMLAGSSGN